MSARPLVSVHDANGAPSRAAAVPLPGVFTAPLRPDLVQDVHARMSRNHRQPYAVSKLAGHQTSAESWGTGRAVARIPRVAGAGTHRAGQGAFGNMCRGGRMFAPTKTWRRWHRKINLNEKRYAMCSAIAASGVTALVMARGHRVDHVPEIPLVVETRAVEAIDKTKDAMKLMRALGAAGDIDKVKYSRHIRPGKGKMRNRRYVQKKGPLVVYDEKGPLVKACRNLPGVSTVCVRRLSLLELAPGGHLGRFVIWTRAAFERLDALYGTPRKPATEKAGYRMPTALMTNTDLARIINSQEVQSVLRPKKSGQKRLPRKKNPLRNLGALIKLNPQAKSVRRAALLTKAARQKQRAALLEARRKGEQPPKRTPNPKKRTPAQIRKRHAKAHKEFKKMVLQ